MTDRANAFIVVLEHDLRTDDAALARIDNALRMIQGVVDVKPHIGSVRDVIAEARAASAWSELHYAFLDVATGPLRSELARMLASLQERRDRG